MEVTGKPGKHKSSFEFVHTITTISLDFEIMDNIMDQIPTATHAKLVTGGHVVRDDLPGDMRMDRWDRVKEDSGLSGSELSQLMMTLCVPKEIRDKLVAGGYDLDDLPNTDTNMARWNEVRADCGLSVRELSRLMNALFPVGK
jgi:hypothetical protein